MNAALGHPGTVAHSGPVPANAQCLASGQAWYVVGIAVTEQAAEIDRVLSPLAWPGGAKPVVRCGQDAAVIVVPVISSEFVGSTGEANLANVSWLGPRAAAHERILREALRIGPVMPCRFGTLLTDDAAALRLATDRAADLATFTALTREADEFTVRIVFDRPTAMKAFMQDSSPVGGSGAAYLLRRKKEQDAAAKLVPWLTERVQASAADLVLQPPAWLRAMLPGRARKAEGSLEPLLAIATLVDRRGVSQFDAAVDELASQIEPLGCHIELDGPMPAYSFAGPGAA